MFETLVATLTKETAGNRRKTIGDGILALRARVSLEDELRVFVDSAPNFGHQAASIFVMKWCIERLLPKKVLIIYRPGHGEDEEPTLPKLEALLPDFDGNPASVIKVGGVEVAFREWKKTPEKPVLLAVAGGADNKHDEEWLSTMNVRLFLRLQPYLWDVSPNEIVYFDKGAEATLPFDEVFDEPFFRRAWIIPIPVLEPKEWTELEGKGTEPQKRQVVVSHQLFNSLEKRPAVVMSPVYGLRYFNQTRAYGTSSVTALAAGVAAAQKDVPRPAVLCLLSDPLDGAEDQQLLDQLLAGGPTDRERQTLTERQDATKQRDQLIKDEQLKQTESYEEKLEAATQQVQELGELLGAYEDREKVFDQLAMPKRVKYYANPSAPDVEQIVNALGEHEIAVLQIVHKNPDDGKLVALPPPVFNTLFKQGKLPSVFEGANTATTALSLGRPYLHLLGDRYEVDDQFAYDVVLYPSELIKADNYAAEARYCQTAANALLISIPDPELDEEDAKNGQIFSTYNTKLAEFLVRTANPEDRLVKYFRDIAEFYNTDVEDKIALAAGFLGTVSKELAPALLAFLSTPVRSTPPPTPPPAV